MTTTINATWMLWKRWSFPDFKRFSTKDGMNGLAKESDGCLDILAVDADEPGNGAFRRFITACQDTYRTVRVWQVWNPIVAAALQRYGFHRCTEEILGERQECWSWSSP